MINSTLGYDLSVMIEMITSFWESDIVIRRMFHNKDLFNDLLNHWGPMYWIRTPNNGKWLAQQRKGGEWFIYKDGYNDVYGQRIDEYELLTYMGIDMFGIPLATIIDNFVVEE